MQRCCIEDCEMGGVQMQAVFDKIIEKLEEQKKGNPFVYGKNDKSRDATVSRQTLDYAIEIVKQEAEKYNNGWISCSERLPEEAFGCLVTVMDCNPSTQTDFENILPYFVGYDGDSWNDADGEEIPFEVIAWRKLPTPYQPKGE